MGFNNDRSGFGCSTSAKTYTVEGYPLILPDIKKLKTLSVLGNSSQDGTPSPDNPVEVVGTGERTWNLFDISSLSGSNIEVKGTDIYLSGYACSTNTSPEKFMEMTGTQQNDMITVFLKTDVIHGFSNSALGRSGFVRKKDNHVVYLNYNKQASVFTIPSDFSSENYGNMILYGPQLADETGQRIAVVSEPAVYKGSYTADTLPSYEPYGYKVAVRAESEQGTEEQFCIYSPQELQGTGKAHDAVVIDFENKTAELRSNVNKIELNGAEQYREYTNVNNPYLSGFYIANYLPSAYNRASAISNIFSSVLESKNCVWIGYDNKNLYFVSSKFYNSNIDDKGLSDFAGYLKQQYVNGDPAIIYYDNSQHDPATTDITALQDWEAMPQLHGTWILTASGGTEPTLKAAYTSNTNPYPDYSNIVSVLPIYPDLDITGDDPTAEGVNTEETEDQQETTSTDEPTSETNNSIDILDLYE